MTFAALFWFLLSIIGALMIGYMVGRHDVLRIVLGDAPSQR